MGAIGFRRPPPAPDVALPKSPEPSWFDKILATIEGVTGVPLTNPEHYERNAEALQPYIGAGEIVSALPTPMVAMSVLGKGLKGAMKQAKTATRIPNPIKAYHGSPHDFEAFDASKIGTGEGAQAYGHGLYFAENERVAKEYRKNLERTIRVMGDEPYNSQDPRHLAASLLDTFHGSPDPKATVIKELRANIADPGFTDQQRDVYRKTVELLEKGEPLPTPSLKKSGKTYEVNIHAEPDEFLDWDTPLSAQPQKVREALQPIIDDMLTRPLNERALEKLRSGTATGHDLYMWHSGERALEEARVTWPAPMPNPSKLGSESVREKGIKGIQYLDQGSRRAQWTVKNDYGPFTFNTETEARKFHDASIAGGHKNVEIVPAPRGTKNYVIFPGHEDLIEIAKKYGIPLATVQAAYAAYQRDQQQVPLSVLGGQ